MEKIGDFKILKTIAENSTTEVFRAIDKNNQQVILKRLKDDMVTPNRIARFKHEHNISNQIQSDYIISSREFIANEEHFLLVMSDYGGISLSEYIENITPITSYDELIDLITIAIEICNSVSDIHQNHFIHKDINPSNIILNQENKNIRIIDFGLTTSLTYERFETGFEFQLEGTYPYISPEQTGKINRGIDNRTDLYSLGITLYELFSGKLPFSANGPREWIHCHVAQKPFPLIKHNSLIPQQIWSIIEKLINKNADSRYQSAFGVKKDLLRCIKELKQSSKIDAFTPGQEDVSPFFHAPEKLYGRQEETEIINQQLAIAHKGNPAGLLVKGYSGIGKSALVGEVQKEVIGLNGYYVKGKFDQFKKDIPFQGVVQAFTHLIRILLSETDDELKQWKEKIRSTLGLNTGLMVELIPELKHIVGEYEKPIDLQGAEANKRLMVTFQQFVQLFTQHNHLLVVFIDDLQWADYGSIELIKQLFTNKTNNSLLLIGAYRDNEVGEGNPVRLLFGDKEKENINIKNIELKTLTTQHISEWLSDIFRIQGDQLTTLAEVCAKKSQGNPLFLMEFLSSLVKNQTLKFSPSAGKWVFDVNEIDRKEITDSVGSYISLRLKSIPEETLQILEIASCVGLRFNPQLISTVTGKPRKEIIETLFPALQNSIIVPMTESYRFAAYNDDISITYRFAHDTIHQQVYKQIEEQQKNELHIKIGRLFLKGLPNKSVDELIYELLRHLNIGKHLLSLEELHMLASLNLKGVRRATQTGAFTQARTYAETALLLIDDALWEHQKQLAIDIHLESADTFLLCGIYPIMNDLLDKVKEKSTDFWDLIKVQEIQISAFIAQNRQTEAVDTTINLLSDLGVKLSSKVSTPSMLRNLISTKIKVSRITEDQFKALPVMTDQKILVAMRNMARVVSVLFRSNPNLFVTIALTLIKLTIKHGIAPLSPLGFVVFGMLDISVFKQYKKGYRFAQLGMSFFNKIEAKEYWAQAAYINNVGLRIWNEPLHVINRDLLEVYQIAQQVGDYETMMQSSAARAHYLFRAGSELSELQKQTIHFKQSLDPYNQEISSSQFDVIIQMMANFRLELPSPDVLTGAYYDEQKMLDYHQKDNDGTSIFNIYLDKLTLAYSFREYDKALEYITICRKHLSGVAGLFMFVSFHFYETLTLTQLFRAKNQKAIKLKSRIKKNIKLFEQWAEFAPLNYTSYYYLMKAEWHSMHNNLLESSDWYDKAIAQAKKEEFIDREALFNELAGRFWLNHKKNDLAYTYIEKSYKCYLLWGATSKANLLKDEFVIKFGKQTPTKAFFSSISSSDHSSSAADITKFLDIETIMEASNAISGEIRLSELLKKTLHIILVHAGASRGALIVKNSKNELELMAEGEVQQEKIDVNLKNDKIVEWRFPVSVIKYIERTQELLILNNANQEGNFINDSYIKSYGLRSIICIPITYQAQFTGMLYLENNYNTNVFFKERVNILNILCTQLAIALENAILYNEMEEKVKERTREISLKNTTLEEQKEELEKTQEQLNELIATKDKFFRIIAHDLKGPLANINTFLDILASGELEQSDPEYFTYIKQFSESSQTTYDLLNNLLTWARSQRDEIVFKPQSHALNMIAENTARLFRQSMMEKKINFHNEIEPHLSVMADKNMLDTIIRNLIFNAIKFSNKNGNIWVNAKSNQHYIEVEVQDDGIGMNERISESLFKIENKLPSRKGTEGEKGTGLGLILCKEFVEKNNGKIWVQSKEGEGTSFFFTLPLA
jgi:predicted ATPase/signal transduction histidine kinase